MRTLIPEVTVSHLSTRLVVALGALCMLPASPVSAAPSFPTNIDIIRIRSDCSGITDCWPDLDQELLDWIWQTRLPGAASPLLLDIGPGSFSPFLCTGGGYVSLRGAGTRATTLRDGTTTTNPGVDVTDCTSLGFQDLAIVSDDTAIRWKGTGSARWVDVEVHGGAGGGSYGVAFRSVKNGTCTAPSQQTWFASKLQALGGSANIAYWPECSTSDFLGGELDATLAQSQGALSAVAVNAAVWGGSDAVVRVTGAALRSRSGGFTGAVTYPFGVHLGANAVFEMHGGIINVNTIGGSGGPTALDVTDSAVVRTNATSFNITAGTSGDQAKRVSAAPTATVESIFQWDPGDEPPRSKRGDPASPLLLSRDGSDLFVETDCDASGCSGGSEPHLLVYSGACGAVPWFDTVLRTCHP